MSKSKAFERVKWPGKVEGISTSERLLLFYLCANADNQTETTILSSKTMTKGTGLSRATLFRALEMLEVKGLIFREKRNEEGERDTSRRIFLRVGRGVPSPKETHKSHHETHKPHNETVFHNQSYYQIYDQIKTAPTSSDAFDHPHPYGKLTKAILGGEVKLEEFMKESQKTLTVEQAIHKAKNGKESYSSQRLGVLWKDLCSVLNVGVYQAPPTMKMLGQFAQLQKKLGGLDTGRVMEGVIRDWVGFGKFLKNQGLVSEFPDAPKIGFFLKHGESAVEFIKKQETPSSGGLKSYTGD